MYKLNQCIFLSVFLIIGNAAYSQTVKEVKEGEKNSEVFSIKQRFIEWMLTDQKFIDKALESGRAEVELSQLAMTKSGTERIKDFAKKMVDDHNKASLELKAIAQARNLNIPLEMDVEHSKALKKLQSLDGAGFDAYYIDLMLEDHDKAVSLFVAASADKKLDAQIQSFAQKTLPVLRAHLAHAKSLGTGEIR